MTEDTQTDSSPEVELQNAHHRYLLHFAEQSRITRHIPTLQGIIESTEDALARLPSNKDSADARTKAEERIAMFREEISAIAKAQEAGPEVIEATVLAQRGQMIRAEYQRHFAGQSRGTRDWLRLEGMADDLAELQEGWPGSFPTSTSYRGT
jgi:hypothetical protein